MPRVPQLPSSANISADDLIVLYDNTGDITGKATLSQAVVAGGAGLIGTGDMILSAAQTVTGAKQFNPGTLLDKGNLVYNVKAYSAVGDGTVDDTTAIQQAINAANTAGGGVVSFPKGTYKITSELTVYSNITLQGVSMESSIIKQATLNANGLHGTAVSGFCIFDLGIQGNSTGSTPGTGTGIGIFLEYGGAGNNPFHNFRKAMVRNWGSDGIKIQTPIVCTFDGVYSAYNGGHGFNWYEGGTSCNFQACWARENAQAGYRFFESVYQNLSGCAADNNGVSYWVEDAQSIGFYACGSEGALKNGGSYDGYGWKIDNSSVVSLVNCWVTDNRNLGVWVTGSSQAIAINAADNSPNGTAVNFTKVDSGCRVTIYELHNTTANSLASGTTTTVNDGTGSIAITGTASVTGASGTLSITAAPDGGEFNIASSASGTMAIYGSAGNTLNVNLLDGKLIVSTSQTPASAAATGTAGTIAWDSNYIYVCVATDTWKRAAISTW